MKKYYFLLALVLIVSHTQHIFSCPCMPSTKELQPFFEQYDTVEEQNDDDNKEEVE
jgi:hypothetical protein